MRLEITRSREGLGAEAALVGLLLQSSRKEVRSVRYKRQCHSVEEKKVGSETKKRRRRRGGKERKGVVKNSALARGNEGIVPRKKRP
jgi:hypothetical protein